MYYKVLAENGEPYHGGRGQWPLLKGKRPGKWLEVKGDIKPCVRGLHLCRKQDLLTWLGPTIYLAEADEGELITVSDKVVVRRARLIHKFDTWNEQTARMFAADCAKDAVRRCRKAGIEIEPGSAAGSATLAAWSAALAAGSATLAAWSAAWSATLAAESAGWSAASAARSAARSAAGSAARSWQTKRLFEYLEGKRHV